MIPPKKRLALPGNILKEIGVSSESQGLPDTKNRWKSQGQNRKDKRKADREQKRQQRTTGRAPPSQRQHRRLENTRDDDDFDTFESSGEADDVAPPPVSKSKLPTKTIAKSSPLKRKRRASEDLDEDDSDEDDIDDFDDGLSKSKQPARAAREKLAKEDAEIKALERKLGIQGRKKLTKAFRDDGLDALLGEGDDDDDGDSLDNRSRMKREADEWLAKKRSKAAQQAEEEESDDDLDDGDLSMLDGSGDDDEDGLDDILASGSDDDVDSEDLGRENDSFGEFEESGDEEPMPSKPRVRENPYVAPVTASDAPKYIPPSLRKAIGKDADLEAQVRRRTQGPVNRATEANLVSIVGEIDKIFRDFPRGVVTDVLTDLLMAQICDPASKPDTLLVLSAGFITALYKVIGVDFGARVLQTLVERFQQEHEAAMKAATEQRAPTKETSNLITALAEMYMFRVVGSNLIFDYVRKLLDDLSELNAELLLRIVRLAGPQLRKDDPLALKDIVTLIRPAVAKIGEGNLSVRTKFMIETINDLKNNKIKAGSQDLAVLNEHVTRMRKILGTMDTNKVKATEPLRIGLDDVLNVDKSGKWWLVGASWGGKKAESKKADAAKSGAADNDASEDDFVIDKEFDTPDYAELAREQGMNTDVRRAIFITLVAASDFQDAYLKILKLRLNKHNRREIANVLVQCSGAQQHYNPYYTLVASKFCADSRIKYSFQDTLWTLFRRLGEPLFGEEPDDEDEDATEDRRLVNTAKMFGNLLRDSSVTLAVLKPLNLAYVQDTTSLFVEVMLITALQESAKNKQKSLEQSLTKIFGTGVTPELARSVRYFIRKKVKTTDLVGSKKEARQLKEACKVAETLLEQVERKDEE